MVVVSAVGGVTNKLARLVTAARTRDANEHYLEGIEQLRTIHEEIAERILPAESRGPFGATLTSNLRDLRDLLRAVWIARSSSERVEEMVLGYGELWSAQLVWAILRYAKKVNASWLDARDVLVTRKSDTGRGKIVNWTKTEEKLSVWLKTNPTDLVIATGFIAADEEGVPTVLGRNGSDFSASCFARALKASSCNIWTDVDGIFSADPRVVPEAVIIPSMSYKEAAELAYFGAKVLHPDTMTPCIESKIPIHIKNTFNPSAKGTVVSDQPGIVPFSDVFGFGKDAKDRRGVKGFSTVENVALVNVEGTGMIGVPGIASRLFNSFYRAGVSVILIAQASSEYSICAALPGTQAEIAAEAARREFRLELEERLVSQIDVVDGCSILAMVGEDMQSLPGVSARLFDAMYKAGVSVRAMAQGSSEHNVSVVVSSKDEPRALRAAHASFCLSDQTISVGIIGRGVVGGALINQISQQRRKLKSQFGIDLRVRAIASSSKMLLASSEIDLQSWETTFNSDAVTVDLNEFSRHIYDNVSLPHAVICDCTASQDVSDNYEQWLRRGIHLVTPNKKANSGPMESYLHLREAQIAGFNSHFFYEANVGAGLPIISTIRDLLRTGDNFIEIQGILSGTLSYIFNVFDGSEPFSTVVAKAKAAGYTEPDPREDLSGMDVARKVVILAREVGMSVELRDVPVESLVPEPLQDQSQVTIAEFMDRLPDYDLELSAMASEAAAMGEKLRYVGVINVAEGKCAVELRRYPSAHQFGGLQGSDNIVLFRTQRYDAQPLTIQGPGAGAEVTAAGVFADLLRLGAYLGAPSATRYS
uniref:ACT domain-containing protein n=2 Tax=Compsopogon caeruleus TaxID=31354 RepID=A0A7S1TI72_9RHOD